MSKPCAFHKYNCSLRQPPGISCPPSTVPSINHRREYRSRTQAAEMSRRRGCDVQSIVNSNRVVYKRRTPHPSPNRDLPLALWGFAAGAFSFQNQMHVQCCCPKASAHSTCCGANPLGKFAQLGGGVPLRILARNNFGRISQQEELLLWCAVNW